MSRVTAGPLHWLAPASVVFYSFFGRSTDILLLATFMLTLYTLQITGSIWALLRGVCRQILQMKVIDLAVSQIAHYTRRTVDTPRWTGPGQPLLLPCKTTHSRMFPKKHSFDYSYLVVGIPVGWEGVAGGMVSCSSAAKQSSGSKPWWSLSPATPKGWYHVDPADYLERGNGHLGLRGKLDAYLKSQGVDPASYPHAYLTTAARFLGYHFNPASFWYLYSADMSLAAMVVEVNNTFDERRMYFLTPAEPRLPGELQESSAVGGSGGVKPGKPRIFEQSWPKDFHVSPFNSRKGSYSLLATDPLNALSEGNSPVDSTITLKSSKEHGKIVARLFSDGPMIDPTAMTIWQRLSFLLSWWWVGFVTFPRIVKEAGRLFFKSKLNVWYRPEPLKESLGRNADVTERKLEVIFRKYLRSLVGQSKAAIGVEYMASGMSDSEVMLSPAAQDKTADVEQFEFKVLTPAFYARFVYYAHDLEALFSELRDNCTIWVSRPDLLPKLLFKKPAAPLHIESYVDFGYFKAIQYLRRRPERIERPLTSSAVPAQAATTSMDIRDFRNSSMDAFILEQDDKNMKKRYMRTVLKLFLADRLALGSVQLLDGALLVFRLWLAWALSHALRDSFAVFIGHDVHQ